MNRLIILFIISFTFLNGFSQKLRSKDFGDSTWFLDNGKEEFYTLDTLVISKIVHFTTSYKTLSKEHVILYYNNSKDTETLNFRKGNRLNVFELSFQFCQPPRGMEDWTWQFDEENQILKLYADKKIKSSFKILDVKIERRSWEYEVDPGKSSEFTTEICSAKIRRL